MHIKNNRTYVFFYYFWTSINEIYKEHCIQFLNFYTDWKFFSAVFLNKILKIINNSIRRVKFCFLFSAIFTCHKYQLNSFFLFSIRKDVDIENWSIFTTYPKLVMGKIVLDLVLQFWSWSWSCCKTKTKTKTRLRIALQYQDQNKTYNARVLQQSCNIYIYIYFFFKFSQKTRHLV